jgi:hypothetical protein
MFQVGTTDHSGHPIQQDNHGLVPAYDKNNKIRKKFPGKENAVIAGYFGRW